MVALDSDFLTSENKKEGIKSITQEVYAIFKENKSCTYHSICNSISIPTTETVRRRIYDVLNVMRAVKLINKQKKTYYLVSNTYSMTKKKAEITKLTDMVDSFKFITTCNKLAAYDESVPKLFLPFMIISTDKKSEIHCDTNNDKSYFNFTSNKPITVTEDLGVLKELKKQSNTDSKRLFNNFEFDPFIL